MSSDTRYVVSTILGGVVPGGLLIWGSVAFIDNAIVGGLVTGLGIAVVLIYGTRVIKRLRGVE